MELAAMFPDNERFMAKTTVLIEDVTHRMDEEGRLVRQAPRGLGTQATPRDRRRDDRVEEGVPAAGGGPPSWLSIVSPCTPALMAHG